MPRGRRAGEEGVRRGRVLTREARRALLRGALPSLLAIGALFVAPRAAPGVVFFALVATALTFVAAALDRWSVRRPMVLLAITSCVLYVIAAVQGVYAAGVLEARSLDGGLVALARFGERLRGPLRDGPFAVLLVAWAALGHAWALRVLEPGKPRGPGEVATVAAGALLVATSVAVAIEPSDGEAHAFEVVGGSLALAMVGTIAALAYGAVVMLLTSVSDSIERRLWPGATLDDSSPPGPSSRPHP